MINTHTRIQELPQSYDFSPRGIDWFSIIVPEATRNLIRNPIFQYNLDGYTAFGPDISRTTEKQYVGPYSMKIAYTSYSRIVHQVNIAAAGMYTFSIYIYSDAWATCDELKEAIYIEVINPYTEIIATKYYTGRGYWDRVSVTFSAEGPDNPYTLSIYGCAGTIAYIDGLQLENKPYATTLCHGDMAGDAYPRKDYWWLGEPHNSFSERSAYCRTGGREMNFFDLGLRTLSIIGIGLAGIGNIIIPTTRGGVYVNSIQQDRTFTIVAERHYPQANIGMRERVQIERLMSPFITSPQQPLMLKYQYRDPCGNVDGEELWIKCLYESGLEGAFDNYQERVGMAFRIYLPYLATGGSFGRALAFDTIESITRIGNIDSGILQRDLDGNWSTIATILGDSTQNVSAVKAFGNYVYVGGIFTDFEGLADTTQIARYNKSTQTWESLPGFDALKPGGFVQLLKISADNKLYAIGRTGAAKWIVEISIDGSLNAIAAPPGDNTFTAFTISPGNRIYASGLDTGSYYVYELIGGFWAKVEDVDGNPRSGFDDIIRDLIADVAGNLYVVGKFKQDETATYSYNGAVVSDDLSASGWSRLGSAGIPSGDAIYRAAIGNDGSLYVAGDFANIDAIPGTLNVAKWNGYSWSALGYGVGYYAPVASINDIEVDACGNVYVVGLGLYAVGLQEGTSIWYEALVWKGSTWIPYEFDFIPDAYVVQLELDDPYVYAAYTIYTNVEIHSMGNTVVVYTADATDAIINITGPGILLRIGIAESEEVFGFELSVSGNEILTLHTGLSGIELISNTRGDLTHEILPGSSSTLTLKNGTNHISVLYTDTSEDSEITIYCDKTYQSLGGAF